MATRVRQIELRRVRLPLTEAFRTARATMTTKDALLVRVVTDDGEGWGECGAQAAPQYEPDTIDTARLVLRDELAPRAFAGHTFDDVRGHLTARAALELALLDARLRAEDVSLRTWLGGTRQMIDAGAAIGIADDEHELRRRASALAAAGYRRLKCKIAPGHDIGPLRAVRAEIGLGVALAADANGSFSLDGALDLVDAVADLDLQCIEQPLAPDALVDHATLVARSPVRICLDESINSRSAARDAIALHACDVLSVKPGRLGMADARVVHDDAVAAGVALLAGGLVETGIGRAALLAVASLPGFTEIGDCAASDRWFASDVVDPFVLEDGRLRVPDGPGLGVDVRTSELDRFTVAREIVTA